MTESTNVPFVKEDDLGLSGSVRRQYHRYEQKGRGQAGKRIIGLDQLR
jgi:hypothetical protein